MRRVSLQRFGARVMKRSAFAWISTLTLAACGKGGPVPDYLSLIGNPKAMAAVSANCDQREMIQIESAYTVDLMIALEPKLKDPWCLAVAKARACEGQQNADLLNSAFHKNDTVDELRHLAGQDTVRGSGSNAACPSSDDPAAAAKQRQVVRNREEAAKVAAEKQRLARETEAAAKQAKLDALPKPDTTTPDSNYVPANNSRELLMLYYAFSGQPPNYEQLLGWLSPEYRQTSDAFRKRDILAAQQPELSAEIEATKAHRYVQVMLRANVNHYDFNAKAFPIESDAFREGGYVTMNDGSNTKLGFSGGEKFRMMVVTDESKARVIEDRVGKLPPMRLRILAFVQTIDDSQHMVQASIVKMQLLDEKNALLAEHPDRCCGDAQR